MNRLVLGLFIGALALLPFSRLSELPILILAMIGLHGLYGNWTKLKSDRKFRILSAVYASYFLLIFISAIDSYWFSKTIGVGFASIRFYLATIALILYFDVKQRSSLLKIITIIILFWAFDAMFQYFVGVDLIGRSSYAGRLNGIFGEHHVQLGPVLALFMPIVMIALNKQHSIIRWLSIILLILTIILSGTRSAWIMMLFVLLAYWLHHVKHRRFLLLLKSVVIAGIMVGSLWLTSPDFQQRVERSLSVFDGTHSGLDFALANRLPIWLTSFEMIQQHPINGVGAHAFRKAYPQFASADDVWRQQGGIALHAHHWILEILTETGIIGLILMGLAVYKLLKFVRKSKKEHYIWAFWITILSAFLPIISTFSLFASFWSICIWLCGAGLIMVSKDND
jgi:O-antigen ligase